MSKKIICTVTNDLSQDQRMMRIAQSLQEQGFVVTLVGRQRIKSLPLAHRSYQQKRLRCYFDKGKLFYIEYNIRLFFYLLFTKFDLINSVDLDTILPATLVCMLQNKVHIHDAHEYFTETPEVQHRKFVKSMWQFVAKFCYPKTTARYTVCESLKTVFKEVYHADFELVRNMPLSRDELNVSTKKNDLFFILYQGVLNAGRGLDEMISAMQHLPNCVLQIAGTGDDEAKLKQLVEQLNLDSQIQFLGFVSSDKLWQLTQQCHIGINLLHADSLNYYYSLANKFFDYVQAEIPSINMNFPEYALLNQQFKVSILIDDLGIQSIVSAVEKLRQNPMLYNALKSNCREAKLVWNWKLEAKKLRCIYAPFV
ncbi:MAG: glycosyltransferase [Saprospiraceae bacterium]|nr:glycosyltransferase [Saprospiraceae bacterium]